MIKKIMIITLALLLMAMTLTSCKKEIQKSATNVPQASSTAAPKTTVSSTSKSSALTTPVSTSATSLAVTDYSIDVDFQIKVEVAGIVFGYVDETQFLMWQINVNDAEGKVFFRPHSYSSAFTVISENDISDAIKWEDRYKTHHMKVTVDSKNEIKTYIDTKLIDTYTDEMAAYGNFGLRENLGVEEAYFDNIVIKNTLNDQILNQIDFNAGVNPFADSSTSEIVTGIMGDSPVLYISKCTQVGDISVLP